MDYIKFIRRIKKFSGNNVELQLVCDKIILQIREKNVNNDDFNKFLILYFGRELVRKNHSSCCCDYEFASDLCEFENCCVAIYRDYKPTLINLIVDYHISLDSFCDSDRFYYFVSDLLHSEINYYCVYNLASKKYKIKVLEILLREYKEVYFNWEKRKETMEKMILNCSDVINDAVEILIKFDSYYRIYHKFNIEPCIDHLFVACKYLNEDIIKDLLLHKVIPNQKCIDLALDSYKSGKFYCDIRRILKMLFEIVKPDKKNIIKMIEQKINIENFESDVIDNEIYELCVRLNFYPDFIKKYKPDADSLFTSYIDKVTKFDEDMNEFVSKIDFQYIDTETKKKFIYLVTKKIEKDLADKFGI
jgi:hypothetical protein